MPSVQQLRFNSSRSSAPEARLQHPRLRLVPPEQPNGRPSGPAGAAVGGRHYSRGSAEVDLSVMLYETHEQALAALSEPAFGPVEKLPSYDGLVRKNEYGECI